MSQDKDCNESRMQSLHSVLAEYIRRQDSGEAVDIESFCAAYPELADGLRSYAEGEGMLEALAGPPSVTSDNLRSAETLRPGAAQRTDFASQVEFGRYRLMRQLGNGAMGAVYLAEDSQLGRRVALKIPTRNGTEGPEFLKRFKREAQAAAQLEHPNLCRIYDFGDVNGTPFISMEYIDGPPLAACVGVAAYRDQRRVAEIIVGIATGLQCAHERGILHRDVKSSNVLMKNGEIPCVSDFGLALIEGHQESKLTHEGSILGTPAYMAPEQIQSDRGRIGPHSDVYALGVVLYELLAGQTPFQGGPLVMLNQALNDRPRPLQTIRTDVDPELADFCLRMLEKEPNQRPQSMRDVITFLDTWLQRTSPESQALQAKAEQERSRYEGMKSKVLELVQRGQHAQAIAALEKMQKLTGTVGKEFAEWARTKIPEVKKLPQQLRKAVPDLINTSRQCIRKYDYAQAALLLQELPPDFRTSEAQQTLDKALELQEESDLLLLSLKECVRMRDLQGIEENLKRFLTLKPGNRFAKELWESLQTYSKLPNNQRNYKFDKKGNLQPRVSGSLWDNWLLVGTLCFVLVLGVAYWGITIYLKDGSRTLAVEVNDDWLREQGGSISLDVDGKEHLITAGDTQVKVTFGEHGFSVRQGSTVVHNPQTFSIEKGDTQILHIDATGMRLVHPTDQLTPPDSDELISEGTKFVVDAPRTPLPDGPPGLVKELAGLTGPPSFTCFSPNGRHVAASGGGKLAVWNIETGEIILERNDGWMSGVFDPTGDYLYAANDAIRKFHVASGKLVASFPSGKTLIYSLSVSPDGTKIAAHFSRGEGVLVWDALSTQLLITLPGGASGYSSSVTFINNGQLIASDSEIVYGTTCFDVTTGTEVRHFKNGADPLIHRERQLSVSPNAKSFVAAIQPMTAAIVDIESGNVTQLLTSSTKTDGTAPVWLSSGRHIARGTQGKDNNITIWDIETGQQIHQFNVEHPTAKIICGSPDGRYLVSAGGKYWDGKTVVTGDNQLQVWRLPQEIWPRLKPGSDGY